ncbi:flagellar motor switch phosphatase FliY [Petrotoga sp. 9PWA.NaAc.5.4]|uniref:flagellar motor switch phosphatase FliY n=1 Tax=Petrotoga sp. 9PWA.NaAc.5.4 TaxID=1434328 RepID=UPI000CB487F4|nr:flagellar motor switch phosphatase FliY [Petrotoga sp. 9PWA.NaAc.5.4]PNR92494.1 chemotaxis protein CheC [Petrotoga sp. 9PWA.NaAc.5.4]
MPEQNSDNFLNQSELDALLKGMSTNTKNTNINENIENVDEDLDSLLDLMGEIANITMGSAATTLSTILKRKIDIEYPDVNIIKFKNIKTNFQGEYVVVTVEYKRGLYGMNTLVLPSNLTNIIANVMLGKDPFETIEEINEISLSAVSEAMNQMMGTASTALSEFIKTNIDISPPVTQTLDFSNPTTEFPPIETDKEAYVISIKFKVKITGIAETFFWQFVPVKFAKKIKDFVDKVYQTSKNEEKEVSPEISNESYQAKRKQTSNSSNSKISKEDTVKVNPVEFEEFGRQEETISQKIDFSKLELLMDVPLEIKVELGSVKMTLREILELHEGSLIQLNKLAGEPLDIYANERLIARGEVVVIDENFGIRVTEIVSLRERMKTLR